MLQYAITDRRLFPGDEREQADALIDQARRLSSTPVDILQIREKDLPEPQLQALAHRLIQAVHASAPGVTRVLLNGPAHLAAAVRAHGVHLRTGATLTDVEHVREAFARAALPPPLLSLSCHSLEDVRVAAPLGLNYLLFGPIFEKRVHGNLVSPGLGLDLLQEAAHLAPNSHLLALGGVTRDKVPLCMEAGAAGIAGIRLFLQ